MCITITVGVGVGERQLLSKSERQETTSDDENEGIDARTFGQCVVGIGPEMWREALYMTPWLSRNLYVGQSA
jgi:hypothetical protein